MIAYANYFTDARIKNYVDALLRNGFEVDVFALGGRDATDKAGLRVFSLMEKHLGSSPLGLVVSQLWFILKAAVVVGCRFMQRRYRVVHVHNMPDAIVFCALVPKLGGARVILDVHDTLPEAYATKFDLRLSHPLIKALRWEELWSARFANEVIATNTLHKEVLCEHGIPEDKIDIIMNLGNERLFRPGATRRTNDRLTLAYHGTIAERLGLDLILRAVALAREDCPGVQLLLIGDGDFLPTVRTLIDELDLADCVTVIGFVPVEELPQHLANVDIGIVGNRSYTEAKRNYMLPVKMLEYAAMEIPTITPRLRIIREYFDDDNALFYAPDDVEDMASQIVRACRETDLIETLKRHLRTFNQRYNWSASEAEYLQIVSRLLESRA
jgi:glycosyltransferase involved in cell wall biosynthesis